MDKIQSEYEALQQKLALLRGRGGGSSTSAANPAAAAAAAAGGTGSSDPLAPKQVAAAAQMTPSARTGGKPPAGSETPLSRAPSGENRAPGAASAHPPLPSGLANVHTGTARTREMTPSDGTLALGCSPSDAAAALQCIRFSDRHTGSALCAAAAATFEDSEFVKLCEQAMSAQLQRSKEGATAHTRILELAGGCVLRWPVGWVWC